MALLFFNVGVEIGQLLFIAGVLALTALFRRLTAGRFHTQTASIVPAYAIGGIASFWVIERIAAFWG